MYTYLVYNPINGIFGLTILLSGMRSGRAINRESTVIINNSASNLVHQ